jgi:repressor LexA
MKRLTARQKVVLSALERAPQALPASLAAELGIHLTTLLQHLRALEHKGFLSYESRGVGRSPVIRLTHKDRHVPLLGHIPAGALSEALEHPEGYLALRARPGRFALRVSGDSMAELIQDGDVVLIDKEVEPRPGDICGVRIGGSEVTLKYVDRYPNHPEIVLLRAHNPLYEALEVPAEQVVIDGVYRGLIRGDVVGELLVEGMEGELM